MKQRSVSLAAAAIALFAAHATLAQTPARAEVKQEAAEANKAGQIPGTGTGPNANTTPPISAKSQVSRADVKKESAAANKAGQIPGTGVSNVPQQATGQQSPKEKAATSTTSREDRKKATAEANKAGAIPQTEAQMQAPTK
jgi:predicted aconitase